jgi:hypothetical protein
MASKNINVNDRVQRSDKSGPLGTVKQVRTEVTASSQEAKDKGRMFYVLWDNGTLSCLGADGLEVI